MTAARLRESARAGLYIHIPFCSAICPYCDFAVQTGDAKTKHAFVDTLLREASLWSDWPTTFDSVYFGGGTPSSLDINDLARLKAALTDRLSIAPESRWSLEVNPEDVTAQAAKAWRDLQFHSVSLGVQSFREAELRQLGRRHSAREAIEAVEVCLQSGFETVSVDLIFGLPGQSPEAWRDSLEQVMQLRPEHISCYQLTVHDGTTFGRWRDRGKLVEMPNDAQATLFDLTHQMLAAGGWRAYEVSNFATDPSHRSAHNIKYWQHIPYLGLGPSAHSFDGNTRWWNYPKLGDYTTHLQRGERPIESRESLDADALALETIMLRIRTSWGVDVDEFQRRFGVDLLGRNQALLDTLVTQGLLLIEDRHIRPTVAGLAVADGIASSLTIDN